MSLHIHIDPPRTTYLIAHVVRGAPAFDIANRCDSMGTPDDPGPWWIIPTSGHRAYPYWHQELDYQQREAGNFIYFYETSWWEVPEPPQGWPDHYACNDQPAKRGVAESILDVLGLRPKILIRRRV